MTGDDGRGCPWLRLLCGGGEDLKGDAIKSGGIMNTTQRLTVKSIFALACLVSARTATADDTSTKIAQCIEQFRSEHISTEDRLGKHFHLTTWWLNNYQGSPPWEGRNVPPPPKAPRKYRAYVRQVNAMLLKFLEQSDGNFSSLDRCIADLLPAPTPTTCPRNRSGNNLAPNNLPPCTK